MSSFVLIQHNVLYKVSKVSKVAVLKIDLLQDHQIILFSGVCVLHFSARKLYRLRQ